MLKRLQHQRAIKRLQKAFTQADPALLLKCLTAGISPNLHLPDPNGTPQPLLHLAISAGLCEHARLLLEAGAECSDPDLLKLAVQHQTNPLRLLTLLLQAGADPNIEHGAILFACFEQPDAATIQLLLSRLMEYGGEINCYDAQRRSPLELALSDEQQELSCLLISAGAHLPPHLDSLPCSEALKTLARRNARDLEVRRQLQGL